MTTDRVPTTRKAGCEYCNRYNRACGRHEETSSRMFTVKIKSKWNGEMYEMKIFDLNDVIRANSTTAQDWFSKETMHAFGTRLHRTMHGRYFVTSEFCGFDIIGRAYTIRRVNEDATITTVGEFCGYETGKDAHEAAKRLAEDAGVSR